MCSLEYASGEVCGRFESIPYVILENLSMPASLMAVEKATGKTTGTEKGVPSDPLWAHSRNTFRIMP